MKMQVQERPQIKAKDLIQKPQVHWLNIDYKAVANAFGYSTHNRMMRKYSEKYLDIKDDAEIVLQIVNADNFVYIPKKINLLFTMWEFLDVPDNYRKALYQADAIIVPCNFCKDLFSKVTTKPIYVCYEGVDEKTFKFYQRSYNPKKEKFRFLWVGAPNPRKGYQVILQTLEFFDKAPGVELYIKTTVPKINWLQTLKNSIKNWRGILYDKKKRLSFGRIIKRIGTPQLADKIQILGKNKNVIIDTRVLSTDELVGLYNSAHCFLMPSLGEGWGLTLCEAMATGCPCIAPMHTGIADFFDYSVGFPLKYDIEKFELKNYDLISDGYMPDFRDMLENMIKVMLDYKYALRKGKRASETIRALFTWDRSAKMLAQIINDMEERWQNND